MFPDSRSFTMICAAGRHSFGAELSGEHDRAVCERNEVRRTRQRFRS